MKEKEKILKIENITHMLSHGIDSQKAEFRIPELKAAMRYWWRAINDIDVNEFEKLKYKEANWFGGDISDKESISSPIVLIKKKETIEKLKCVVKVGNDKNSFNMDSLSIGSKFDIEMRLCAWANSDLEYYSNLMKIVSIVGALGQRSRKGYGNFGILENKKLKTFSKNEDVIEFLYENIEFILNKTEHSRAKFEKKDGNVIENTTIDDHKFEYPILRKVFVGKEITLESFYEKILIIIDNNKNIQNKLFYDFKKGSNRYATPIYITCVKSDKKDNIIPVISELSVPEVIQKRKEYKTYIDNFYDEFKKTGGENNANK